MTEKLKKENVMEIICTLYLVIFCILKICALIKYIDAIPINTIMFVLGWIVLILIFINKRGALNYNSLLNIFGIVIIINAVTYRDIETIKTDLFEIFYIFVIYNIAAQYFKKDNYIRLIKIILLITFAMITIFFINYIVVFIRDGVLTKSEIMHMFFSNINAGAMLALINIIMVIYLYKIKKINIGITIFICIYYIIFIFLSYARTTVLTLIILGFYLIYQKYFKGHNNFILIKKIFKGLCVICLCIILFLGSILILKRNYDYTNELDKKIYNVEKKLANITTLRYWLWKYSIQELIEVNPVIGLKDNFGQDSFENMLKNEEINKLSMAQKEVLTRNNVHDGYIQILVKNGLVGFAIIMLFFTKNIFNIFKLDYNEVYYQYIKYIYLFYIFINIFENHIILSNSFFVLFLWIHFGRDSVLIKDINKEQLNKKE